MYKYAVIVGHGRSGTNWLHGMFDLNEQTYCRNEPHELSNSLIRSLDYDRFVVRRDQKNLEKNWDDVIDNVGQSMSSFDAWIRQGKVYFSFGKLIYMALRSNKIRGFLSIFFSRYKKDEWLVPSYAVKKSYWTNISRVYKFILAPGWAGFILQNKPDVEVFHIVRHPGGFLNSWQKRYLPFQDNSQVFELNKTRLRDITHESDYWCNKFGEIDEMDLVETELWYWFYTNETIFQSGQAKSNYTLLTYEDLTDDPVSILKVLYKKMNLSINNDIIEIVSKGEKKSSGISKAWRMKLNEKDIMQCEKFADMARFSFGRVWV